MPAPLKRLSSLLAIAPLAIALGGCGQTVSTSEFKGEQQEVAKTVANLQANVTSGDHKKICANDLASTLVAKLNTASGGCERAIKDQLSQIDGFDVTVKSVQIGGSAAKPTATAQVQSTYSGKKRSTTLSLVKEGGKWKISGQDTPS
jgi:hypothetical protein